MARRRTNEPDAPPADEPEAEPAEPVDEAADLRADYDVLGTLLTLAEGSAAAAIARERRIARARLAEIEKRKNRTVLDEVAARREAQATAPRVPARRRQPR